MNSRGSNMADPGHGNTTQLLDEAVLPAALSSNTASIHSSSSSAPEIEGSGPISSAQPPPSRPLWNTSEGRIAVYKRMVETEDVPEKRANYEALMKYYEDGGKVPEGKEEVWAFDGQASSGIRAYTNRDQIPEGWGQKHSFCDVSLLRLCQSSYRASSIPFRP